MKIGRNNLCWCGSGKKYKHCHGQVKPVESNIKNHPADFNEEEEIVWQFHAVAFIDILGQRDLIRSFDKPPQTEQEKVHYEEVVVNTYGKVCRVREWFHHYSEGLLKQWEENGKKNISLYGDRYRQASELNLASEHFSDTLTFYASLLNSVNETVVMPVYVMLEAAATLLLVCFSEKIALRGGIEIGFAARWPKFGIYGSPLVAAYDLESKVAEYPRIIVGPQLIKFLNEMTNVEENSGLATLNANFAKKALSLLSTDTDGQRIIDFLGKEALRGPQGIDDMKEAAKKGYKFVLVEYNRFKNLNDENSKRLEERYSRLIQYFKIKMQEINII